MSARIVVLVASLMASAACSSLEDVDRDECGNGILEQGEDCDSTNERCVSCGIRCSVDEACATYPGAGDGFVCGTDNFCHAPTGTFRAPTELGAAVESFRITDVDHDGIGDVLVQAPTAVQVFYGNVDGTPVAATPSLTPIARGPASYADLDEDGSLDLLLPTADGIAAYTSTYGVPAPHPFPSVIELGTPLFTHAVAPNIMGFIGTIPGITGLALIRIKVDEPVLTPIGAPICGAGAPTPESDFDPERVDVFTVAPGYQLVAMTLGAETTTPRICVMSMRETATGPEITRVYPKAGAPFASRSRPILAPLAGPCPSLVVGMSGKTFELAGKGDAATGCSFDEAPAELHDGTATVVPVGWLPLGPDLADPRRALVLSDGIYAYRVGLPLGQLYAADRRLHVAKFADVDGDGDFDVIASSIEAEGESEDLDILYRAPLAFLRYRLDTTGPITRFELGDFDGNGRADVAIIEKRERGDIESQELGVAYGTADQLSSPVGLVSFSNVISVVPSSIPDSSDPTDLVTDLVVLYQGSTSAQITLLHGSTQRTLTGFFDPRPPPQPQSQNLRQSVFRGVVGGNFATSGPPGRDLIAVDVVDDSTGIAAQYRTELWLSEGATGGVAEPLVSHEIEALQRCDAREPTPGAEPLCVIGARYIAVPRDGGVDRVIAVGVTGQGVTIDQIAPAVVATPWDAIASLAAGTRLRSLDLVQLTEGPRVIAAFDGAQRGLAVCGLDPLGLPTACTDLVSDVLASEPGGPYTCVDAAPARATRYERFAATPPPKTELVALCRGEGGAMTIFRLAADGDSYTPTRLLDVQLAQELRTGDVNGDGLDDLITLDREGGIPSFRIYTQCTSRTLTGCAGTR